MYKTDLLEWRQSKDDVLRAENSWLALAGLYWLEPGENPFGSDPAHPIHLPAPSAPPLVGAFLVEEGTVTLRVADDAASHGVTVTVDGKPVREALLAPDTSGAPSLITVGDLSLMLLQRGETLGIRLWDNSRPERHTFPGRQWFPIREDFRIAGTYQRFESEHRLRLQRKNGADLEARPEGVIHFSMEGVACSLVAFEKETGELHIMFNDATNGTDTYAAGRYLTLAPPEDGNVIVDFNLAINPPCAFTNFATCLLPPAQNRLEQSIIAGEKAPLPT